MSDGDVALIADATANTCPLCGRELGSIHVTEHHLIPRRYKGKETQMMHSVCHNKIHATFTDQELRDHYHSFERLLEHEDIRVFVAWVSKKPVGFHVSTKMSARHGNSLLWS